MDAALLVALAVADAADGILDLETRRRVHDAVQAHPGLHLRELAREVDLDVNHVKYHLRVMNKHGLVRLRDDGALQRAWPTKDTVTGPTATIPPADQEVLSWLRRPVPLRAILHLLDAGPTPAGDLADVVGVARGTLHHHMRGLQRAGVVAVEKVGRHRVIDLVDAGTLHRLLVAHPPPDRLVAGFLDAWDNFRL